MVPHGAHACTRGMIRSGGEAGAGAHLAAKDKDRDNTGGTGAAGDSAGAAHVLGGVAREIKEHHVLNVRRVDATRCAVCAHQRHLCPVHGRRQKLLRHVHEAASLGTWYFLAIAESPPEKIPYHMQTEHIEPGQQVRAQRGALLMR